MRDHGLVALANAIVLLHLGFVLFVIVGGLLALRWRWIAWLHVPAVLYAAGIELIGWVCPLTPLEQDLRRAAGAVGYDGPFIDHYIGGLLYPKYWDQIHLLLGVLVILLNAWVYARLVVRTGQVPEKIESPGEGEAAAGS
ncbi:MAG: DUF2784 domain-containing protein [Gemmatimonadota bacterium]